MCIGLPKELLGNLQISGELLGVNGSRMENKQGLHRVVRLEVDLREVTNRLKVVQAKLSNTKGG